MKPCVIAAFLSLLLAAPLFGQNAGSDNVYAAIAKANPSVMEIHAGKSLGSGFYVGHGYVVTNKHVVSTEIGLREQIATDIEVVNPTTRRSFNATVAYADPDVDFAILKLDADPTALNIPPAVLGDCNQLQLGETVICIGSPLGYTSTVTIGHVSGLYQYLQTEQRYEENLRRVYMLTDAVVNRGNSGGPLINLRGEVVGINTAVEIDNPTESTSWKTGLSFSIPINMIKPNAEAVFGGREPQTPFLGLGNANINTNIHPDLLARHGLSPMAIAFEDENEFGFSGPLYEAGVRSGDILDQIDDVKLQGKAFLFYKMQSSQWNDILAFRVFRLETGQFHTLNVRVGRRLDPEYLADVEYMNPYMLEGTTITRIGDAPPLTRTIDSEKDYRLALNSLLRNNYCSALWLQRGARMPVRLQCPPEKQRKSNDR